MKQLLFLVFVLTSIILSGQNILPNPNFENFTSCPTDISQMNAVDWIVPGFGTSDYFNVCGGFNVDIPNNLIGNQDSDSGDAYVGLITYEQDFNGNGTGYREYVQAELESPTIEGGCYQLTIIYSPADLAGFSSGLSMLLSNGPPPFFFGQEPQLEKTTVSESSAVWHTLTTQYISPGGETHLTIGNFNSDPNTTFQSSSANFGFFGYYYIDSVSVEYIGESSTDVEVDLGDDITLCEDDFPITITSSNLDAINVWNTGEVGNSIEVNGPGIYSVQAYQGCAFAEDEIEIELFDVPEIEIEDAILCLGEPLEITLDASLGDYTWTGGVTGNVFTINTPGEYSVELEFECGIVSEDFEVEILLPIQLPEPEDLQLCSNELPAIVEYSEFADGINEFLWQDGSEGPGFFITGPGVYTLEVSNDCFSDNIEFEVEVSEEFPSFIEFDDTVACLGQPKLIDIGFEEDVDYLWQDGSTESFYLAQGPGSYTVVVSNFCGLEFFEIEIVEAEELTLNLGEDVELCPGDSVFVSAQNDIEVNWSTGETSEGIWVKEEGELIGLINGNCDVVRDTLNISFNGEIPQISLPDSLLLCEGDTLSISAIDNPSGISFNWNTGDQSNEISVTDGGSFVVTGTNNCGISIDSVFVSVGESLQDPDLQDTYQICPGDSLNISINSSGGTVEWSTGSQDSVITVFNEGIFSVEIENSCKTKSDSFELIFFPELNPFDLGNDEGLCLGDSLTISAPLLDGIYTWNTQENSTDIQINQVGVYTLEIEGICNTVIDSIEILDQGTSPELDLGADVSFCTGDSVTLSVDANLNTSILWNTGSQENSIIIDVPDTYIVSGTNDCGTAFDTIVISINDELPEIDLGEDQLLCDGDSLILDLGNVSGDITWSTGSEESSIIVNQQGLYSASISSSCGVSIDSLVVEFLSPPEDLELEDTVSICFTDFYEISIDVPDDVSILWSTGSMDTFETFLFEGDYSVELSNECGIEIESFTIETIPFLELINLPEDSIICDETSVLIESEISQENVDIIWNTNEETSTIEVDESGLYWVESSNDCYTLRDSINIEFIISPDDFSIGLDDTICFGENIFLDGFQGNGVNYEWQDGETSPTYTVVNSGVYILEASNFCGTTIDSVEITVLDIEEIETPLEDIYTNCEGSSLLIDLSSVIADEIIWDDGSTERIRELLIPSIYSIEFINACFETIVDFTFQQENCGETTVFIPNVFTPNFDGNNDEFLVFLPDEWEIENFELAIYNRWGERVYLSELPEQGWDGSWKGKTLNPGVYVYYVKVGYTDDEGDFNEFLRTGDITILK